MRWLRSNFLVLACVVSLLPACAGGHATGDERSAAAVENAAQNIYDPNAVPTGPVGDSIRLGHDIMVDTKKHLPRNISADMSCAACHVGAGTVKRGGSFVGLYGRFPQWNRRSHRVIALQDRIAECFLYSMNGTPPAYSSKEMIALVAYVAYLSRSVPVGQPQPKDDRFLVPLPKESPDVKHGASIYAARCSSCHGVQGSGVSGTFPPLWGPKSFNDHAGMAHIDRIAGFVRYNMPQNAPGTLSMQDSYDVAQYVLTQQRPKFDKSRSIEFQAVPASGF